MFDVIRTIFALMVILFISSIVFALVGLMFFDLYPRWRDCEKNGGIWLPREAVCIKSDFIVKGE